MSFVCALAGFPEYTKGNVNPYRTEFVNAFRPYVSHPAVVAMRALRTEHAISHDAPMVLAVHLDDQLQLRNAAELATIDARWTGVDVAAFAALLRDFAKDSKLDDFLAAHRAHYTALEDALRTAIDAERPVEWVDALFGARTHATYTVVPSPMTGSNNMGVRATLVDGTLQMFQLIGIDTASGLPVIDNDLVYLIVHELAHSYVNPVLAEHTAELAPAAAKLYAKVEQPMRAQAYPSWQTMVNESVVRAATVLYLRDRKGAAVADAVLEAEVKRGFLWTKELVKLLSALQRDHQDYVPRLAALLAQLAG